ncbi:MAG: hypothetical protein DWI58_17760 [Chloroflexi bacterium]|nr:MAG: hypothetical protein DWI58_17760 [Chloroflexota bacterium]
MRFKRSDVPGILIATVAPAALFSLLVLSFGLEHHHGTPLLGALAGNVAGGAATLAVLSRFVRRWDRVVITLALLIAAVLGVILLQRTGNDGGAFATSLKLAGVLLFGVINLFVILDVLVHGLNPSLQRRDARLARERAEAQ